MEENKSETIDESAVGDSIIDIKGEYHTDPIIHFISAFRDEINDYVPHTDHKLRLKDLIFLLKMTEFLARWNDVLRLIPQMQTDRRQGYLDDSENAISEVTSTLECMIGEWLSDEVSH